MVICGSLCILLILCMVAYAAGITCLILAPLFLANQYPKLLRRGLISGAAEDSGSESGSAGSESESEDSEPESAGSEPESAGSESDIGPLKSYDPAVLKLMHTPMGDYYRPDDTFEGDKFVKLAEQLYKEHNVPMPDLAQIINYNADLYPDNTEWSQSHPGFSDKFITRRTLSEDYPSKRHDPYAVDHIVRIEYTSTPQESGAMSYEKLVDLLCRYTILLNIRELTTKELDEVTRGIALFEAGKLTVPPYKVHMKSGEIFDKNTCRVKQEETPTRNALHWGQRKLLLSEIDFINRAAADMGAEKFKSNPVALLYPGSAHGDHLMILMELYPNLILYLWDPARYNNVLYLVEFMRRKLPLPKHTKYEMDVANKYKGRIFINMDLSDSEFITYHRNSSNNEIPKNYETQHGFFLDSSIKYFQEYRARNKDTSTILFVSDIRMYSNFAIHNFLAPNAIGELRNPILKYFHEMLSMRDYVRDMELQKNWFIDSKSDYGLFKFKITMPYSVAYPRYMEYLDGDIIIQAWGPRVTTETRLFVKPNRRPTAYYNIQKYRRMMSYVNIVMRLKNVSARSLKSLNMPIQKSRSPTTMGDIWRDFLPPKKIASDALLETYIIYDYIKLQKSEVSETDILLMISDITQTLINKTDQTGILRYLRETVSKEFQKKIFGARRKYHANFNRRLDFNSKLRDNLICTIKDHPGHAYE